MMAEEIPRRRQQALDRLPALLAAWVKASKAMLTVPPESFVARAVVADEIKQFQGFAIPFEEVDYEHFYDGELDDEPIASCSRGYPLERRDIYLRGDKRLLRQIVKALRRAWRDATGEREPSLGGLNSAKGLRACLVKSLGDGLDLKRSLSRVRNKIEDTEARWNHALEQYRQKIKPSKRRPAPAESPPQFVIFETDNRFEFNIKFKDGRRHESPRIRLTAQELEVYMIVRKRRLDDDEEGRNDITTDELCGHVWHTTYRHQVNLRSKRRVQQNLRAVVSRFNRAWFRATGDGTRILTPVRRCHGTWIISPIKIVRLKDKE